MKVVESIPAVVAEPEDERISADMALSPKRGPAARTWGDTKWRPHNAQRTDRAGCPSVENPLITPSMHESTDRRMQNFRVRQPEGRRRQDDDHPEPRRRASKESGHRVLCVDLDPQGNLTMSQGIDPDKVEKSLFDVLVHDIPI